LSKQQIRRILLWRRKADLVVMNVPCSFSVSLVAVSAPTYSSTLLSKLVSTGATPLKRCALTESELLSNPYEACSAVNCLAVKERREQDAPE